MAKPFYCFSRHFWPFLTFLNHSRLNRVIKGLWDVFVGMRPPSAPSAGMGREGESDIKLRLQQARATSAAPGYTNTFVINLTYKPAQCPWHET